MSAYANTFSTAVNPSFIGHSIQIWYNLENKGFGPEERNNTMNKTELVEVVSSKAEITKVEAQKVVTATLDAIIEGIVKDGKVILSGFGSFETRQRSARSGRNPRTGETIKIKATKAPAFKPGKALKDKVNTPAKKKGKK